MTTTGKINIAGALHSIDNTGIVVYTGDVYDPIIDKNQQQINYDHDQQISQCSSAIEQQQTINDTQAIINEQQIEINNQQDQKIKYLETKIDNIESGGGTITPSNYIKYEVMTEEEYNNLSEIKADTFYFTYLEEESSPEEPSVSEVILENSILDTSFILDSDVLTTTGILNNNILTL